MKHPAVYTESFLPIFARLLQDSKCVLDPFAGTGKLAAIKEHGYTGTVICNELEPEWVQSSKYNVDIWNIGDAQDLSWAKQHNVDAICTSPTYGNRMADHHEAKDDSRRITYRHYLGRRLSENNSGMMQWGEAYKKLHRKVYEQCFNILPQDGILVINISNHIRKGVEVDVTKWHQDCLTELGFRLVKKIDVPTPRMRFGANSTKRISYESILVFIK
jgi:tRNA G10  N-methylase Trm11